MTTPTDRDQFKSYRRSQIAELRPYEPGESMDTVSVSQADRDAGSPKLGDMIARNPKNHTDRWLVAAQYFADNFEDIESRAQPASIPNEAMAARLDALSDAVTRSAWSEFSMRVPAEPQRDADLVLAAAAKRIRELSPAQPASVADNCVLVALHRPEEGYGDVHPELVAEDAIRQGWHYDVLTAPQPPAKGDSHE